jgi:hypothetical protein
MDEYDVFLDEKARRKTLDMIQEYVKHSSQKGTFFFLLKKYSN